MENASKMMMAFCAQCGERFEVERVGGETPHECPQTLKEMPARDQNS